MSVMEQLLWNVLGYVTMPLLFLGGFIAVSVAACLVLSWLDKRKSIDRDQ
ncbi:TIGR02808 family protein [Oceanimonas doudoroffii]|uniref:TIGR02808 family protein n=1 Tax=Oceanimonas doudoroffii TaxID=84158 RepID=A0A233RHA7_9GAMM|nr:TIGR02808 family protein [Oceanimonas doudoroffii]OXY82767.1 TIGR02808 family protein [Oceanimonas doudoroffii]